MESGTEELEGWNGDPKLKNDIEAKKQALETVDFFNAGLREWEAKRIVIGIRKTEKIERVTDLKIEEVENV